MTFDRRLDQPSVMNAQAHFSRVPSVEIERSRFDRTSGYKTTFDAGQCIPFYIDEILPGDTFTMNSNAVVRLATPQKPFMDNISVDMHFFFVPMRLVWDNWENFMGQRDNPEDDPNDYSIPVADWDGATTAPIDVPLKVGHYLGLPMRKTTDVVDYVVQVSCLPFRAVALIWNEWYRDQNLQGALPVPKGDFDPVNDLIDLEVTDIPRGKRHDYFTSCLPWPQKGDPVTIPLGDEAIVRGYFDATNSWSPFSFADDGDPTDERPVQLTGQSPAASDGVPNYASFGFPWNDSTAEGLHLNPNLQVGIADLSTATSISINALRTAFQIQRLLERDARGGTRYPELILAHFGVHSSDARLQRPEFLGGGTAHVNVSPIASTATVVGEDPVPQGNLAAVGTSQPRAGFQKSFEEHGYVIGICSARADLTYQRTVDRMWTRRTRYDFYWPALAHLGEQAVLNRELYYSGDPEIDEAVFGYQERYAEYRYRLSKVTGVFNSDVTAPLDVWHLAQEFSEQPALNEAFIVENPPIDRVIAVPSEPHFIADFYMHLMCDRPMPVYGTPGLIDHF